MVQIINSPDLGALTGQTIGTGLGEGLLSLAQNRLGKIQQREHVSKVAEALQGLGFAPEQAQHAAYLPESSLKELIKQQSLGPSRETYASALQELLGGGAQQPQQPLGAPEASAPGLNIPKKGLTESQATKLAELGLKKQEKVASEKAANQRHIEKLNAPVLEKIEEKAIPAKTLNKLSNELLQLLDTGKVITGLKGRFTPKELQTEEGQQFLAKINQLVLQKAQLGKGVPTKLRLSLEQLSKPDIWQKPKAIRRLLQDIQNDELIQEDIAKDLAREQILQESGESQPRNIKSLIEKRAKEIIKNTKKPQEQTFENLPPAKQFEGKTARNPATGQRVKSVNGQWVEIK